MAQIIVHNLSFGYDGEEKLLFNNASFSLDTDWKLGFSGRNGCGKTTFLKLLLGLSGKKNGIGKSNYSGTIISPTKFEYFPFSVDDLQKDTYDIVEKILAKENTSFDIWSFSEELRQLQIEAQDILYRPFTNLSSGEQTKILLATLFLKEHNFLLIDEPTNHLDIAGRHVIATYLSQKKGFILISHDRFFLDSCIDHLLVINKCTIEIHGGNFSHWETEKKLQREFEEATNEKLNKEIHSLQKSAQQKQTWATEREKTAGRNSDGSMRDASFDRHRAAKIMKRSKSLQQLQEKKIVEKKSLLQDAESNYTLIFHPLEHPQKTLITVQELSAKIQEREIFSSVNFSLTCGERFALCGENGSGKSTLLKLILRQTGILDESIKNVATKGTISVAPNLQVQYIPQNTTFLHGNVKDFCERAQLDEVVFKASLFRLGMDKQNFDTPLDCMSEGQKKKMLIACGMSKQAQIYLWDEPLNYLDIFSRIQIEKAVKDFNLTMIFIEHDTFFLNTVATQKIKMSK